MFYPSRIIMGAKRLPMTSKQGRQFYKGSGTGSMGGYIIDWKKVRTFIVPSGLDTTSLTPFVTLKVRPMRSSFESGRKHGFDGYAYYKQYKQENIEEKKRD
ncbi:hypothetical protein PCK1_002574 [Pneumocystis canis]|nr:hypothetical protein PCK1_002574 [Pneumocystis canis]